MNTSENMSVDSILAPTLTASTQIESSWTNSGLSVRSVIICSLGEEPVKITKETSSDKFQMRF